MNFVLRWANKIAESKNYLVDMQITCIPYGIYTRAYLLTWAPNKDLRSLIRYPWISKMCPVSLIRLGQVQQFGSVCDDHVHNKNSNIRFGTQTIIPWLLLQNLTSLVSLSPTMLWENSADDNLMVFFLFFLENWIWILMQIVTCLLIFLPSMLSVNNLTYMYHSSK